MGAKFLIMIGNTYRNLSGLKRTVINIENGIVTWERTEKGTGKIYRGQCGIAAMKAWSYKYSGAKDPAMREDQVINMRYMLDNIDALERLAPILQEHNQEAYDRLVTVTLPNLRQQCGDVA